MIRFKCKNCGRPLKAPLSAAGHRGTCPKCKEKFRLPSRHRIEAQTGKPLKKKKKKKPETMPAETPVITLVETPIEVAAESPVIEILVSVVDEVPAVETPLPVADELPAIETSVPAAEAPAITTPPVPTPAPLVDPAPRPAEKKRASIAVSAGIRVLVLVAAAVVVLRMHERPPEASLVSATHFAAPTTTPLVAVAAKPPEIIPQTLDEATTLFQQQRYSDAMKILDVLQRQGFGDEKLAIDALNAPYRFRAGRTHLYLLFPQFIPADAATPTARPWDNAIDGGSTVQCIDASSGKTIWSRICHCGVDDLTLFAVDPANDDLYLGGRTQIVHFQADSGRDDVAIVHQSGPIIGGIERAGMVQVRGLTARDYDNTFIVYSLDTRTTRSTQLTLFGDSQRITGLTFAGNDPAHPLLCLVRDPSSPVSQRQWTYPTRGFEPSLRPQIFHGDVFALQGESGQGSMIRLDGLTGKPRWQFPIPHGEYILSPAMTRQFEGSIFCANENALIVADSAQSLHFVDIETGAQIGEYAMPEPLQSEPAIVDGTLYFAGATKLRALFLQRVLHPLPYTASDIAGLRARIVAAVTTPEAPAIESSQP